MPNRPLTVEANMGLVHKASLRYRWAIGTVLEAEDLIQAGAIGVMRALETYDPARASFSTYAFNWIRLEMQRAIQRGRRAVCVDWRMEYEAKQRGDTIPLDPVSLDAPLCDGSHTTGLDMLAASDDHASDYEGSDMCEAVQAAVDRLPERIRGMVRAKYSGKGRTLRDIGDEHGLSRERVRQLVAMGVKALRRDLKAVEV